MMTQPTVLLEMPEYINKVQIAKTRKPIYYTPKKKIPAKYLNSQYVFSKGVLVVRKTGLPVIANANSLGKPAIQTINGQHFYSGFGSPHLRILIVNAIKDFMRPYVMTLPKLTGPLRLSTELHTTIGQANWDLDNLWIYNKCFQDLLTECKKVPDDCIKYITGTGGIDFYPVSLDIDRKLIYVIEPERRPCIIQHPLWQKNQLLQQ
jgi:hypothetical protein